MRACLIGMYRLLLLLQPRAVRRRYGAEMMQLIRERAADATPSFWIREYADAVVSAGVARRATAGWLLVGSAAMHSGYAAVVYPQSSMGIAAVLLTANALLIGAALVQSSRRGTPQSR